MIIFFRSVAMN